jgi:UDP-glucose 4-epimerase
MMPSVAAWNPGEPKISWHDPPRALFELGDRVERFSRDVAARPRSWAVLWCAGAGVVGTSAEDLAAETAYLERLLHLLREHLSDLPGQVLLASSAGGVYGNNPEQPLTEGSLCTPISDYGKSKLRQEGLLQDWANESPNVSTLIARISNLYGPGQNVNKAQGLIAHISRSLLHHTPVHVYVSLDTLRDYLFAADCAAHLVRCLDRLRHSPRDNMVKIFSGGQTVTIAGIIAAFARIAKGHPRIICAANSARPLQPARLQFQSTVWTDLPAPTRTDLAAGIQRVHQHLLLLFQQGRLPPSAPH